MFLLYKTDFSNKIVAQKLHEKGISLDDNKRKIVDLIKVSPDHEMLSISALTEMYPSPTGHKVGDQYND